jgi:hypothetical protein
MVWAMSAVNCRMMMMKVVAEEVDHVSVALAVQDCVHFGILL